MSEGVSTIDVAPDPDPTLGNVLLAPKPTKLVAVPMAAAGFGFGLDSELVSKIKKKLLQIETEVTEAGAEAETGHAGQKAEVGVADAAGAGENQKQEKELDEGHHEPPTQKPDPAIIPAPPPPPPANSPSADEIDEGTTPDVLKVGACPKEVEAMDELKPILADVVSQRANLKSINGVEAAAKSEVVEPGQVTLQSELKNKLENGAGNIGAMVKRNIDEQIAARKSAPATDTNKQPAWFTEPRIKRRASTAGAATEPNPGSDCTVQAEAQAKNLPSAMTAINIDDKLARAREKKTRTQNTDEEQTAAPWQKEVKRRSSTSSSRIPDKIQPCPSDSPVPADPIVASPILEKLVKCPPPPPPKKAKKPSLKIEESAMVSEPVVEQPKPDIGPSKQESRLEGECSTDLEPRPDQKEVNEGPQPELEDTVLPSPPPEEQEDTQPSGEHEDQCFFTAPEDLPPPPAEWAELWLHEGENDEKIQKTEIEDPDCIGLQILFLDLERDTECQSPRNPKPTPAAPGLVIPPPPPPPPAAMSTTSVAPLAAGNAKKMSDTLLASIRAVNRDTFFKKVGQRPPKPKPAAAAKPANGCSPQQMLVAALAKRMAAFQSPESDSDNENGDNADSDFD